MRVSIICACKNRNQTLNVSINSWLKYPEVHEIIIVDWSSDKPLNYLTKLDPRIKIINVKNEKYFNMPQPLNLAASISSGDRILVMSVDYILNPYEEFNFFTAFDIDDKSFLCGEIDSLDSITVSHFLKYLRGILYLTRNNFFEIGGYNEDNISHYGNDDGEIEHRLQLFGLEKKRLSLNSSYCIFHIPHSNKKRIENFESYSVDKEIQNDIRNQLSQYCNDAELDWQVDYILTEQHISINQKKSSGDNYFYKSNTKWDIIKLDEQIYVAKKIIKES